MILKTLGGIPTEEEIMEAAAVAAENSQASGGPVSVDCTAVKYVKKPSGALPGKVIFTNQRTVTVRSC